MEVQPEVIEKKHLTLKEYRTCRYITEIDGVPHVVEPVPKWVDHCLMRGIGVKEGAWGCEVWHG